MKGTSATVTVTSKGQVTIPVEIRRYLGLKQGARLSFVVSDNGDVVLQIPKFSTVVSLAGAAGTLRRPLETDEMLDIAREDALADQPQRTPVRR